MSWKIVVKKLYDKLLTTVNAIDTKIPCTGELSLEQYESDKQGLGKKIKDVDKKILNTTVLVKKTDYITKITEI